VGCVSYRRLASGGVEPHSRLISSLAGVVATVKELCRLCGRDLLITGGWYLDYGRPFLSPPLLLHKGYQIYFFCLILIAQATYNKS
jgi:hypothetical protein